jgi:hydroxymethylpyrimidine kinase/phosphomethylpyrimidine kinase
MNEQPQPVCLTIAGLDPSGGAGVIADVKTFSAFGCYAAAAITSITYQNTVGVFGAAHQTAETVRRQIDPVFEDLEVSAVKTGMLPTEAIIKVTAEMIRQKGLTRVVVDPVVRSTSGFDLIDDVALRALVNELFPLAAVVTPNIPEAERISGVAIRNFDDVKEAARKMSQLGTRAVLIKGGHLEASERSVDHLFIGGEVQIFDAERIRTTATHGTGCTLSSAIAANLALGLGLNDAIATAKRYVTEAIRTAPNIGHGNSPINQLIEIS